MFFTIINIWERIYKKIIYFLVIGITIWSAYWYINLEDKTDTFIVSTLYALFLFVIGIYMNYMQHIIDEKFYDRTDYYFNLKRLKDVFNTMIFESYSDEDVFEAIITFKVFTGRTDSIEEKPVYVSELGLKYNYSDIDIENDFIKKRNSIINKLNISILDYINKNSIDKKCPYPRINNVQFNTNEWCNKHCNLNNEELKSMEKYINDLLSTLRNEMADLGLLMKSIMQKYRLYKKEAEWNIKKIESIYGTRLKYEIYKEDQYFNEIKSIKVLLEQVNNNMCSYNNYEELLNNINDCNREICLLHEEIHILENNLSKEIDEVRIDLLDN